MTQTFPTKTRAELAAYVERHGFRKGQGRIGVDVYLSPGKRPKHELTVGEKFACMYERSPRRLAAKWELRA